MAEKQLTQAVSKLADSLDDSKVFYETAASNAVDPQLKELFRERAQRRGEFAAELVNWDSDQVDIDGDPLEAIQRGLMTVKAAMTIERDRTDFVVLNEAQEAEKRLLEHYHETLSEELPERLRSIIKRQYAQVQAAYAFVGAKFKETGEPIVIGMFAELMDAQRAINKLDSAGFDREQVSVLAQEEVVKEILGDDPKQTAKETAGATALSGGIIGGLIGLVAGLTIPIAFPVLAAGTIAAALGVAAAGAGIGASYGGIFGALIGWGVAEEETHRYVEGVRRGEILIAVHTEPERIDEASAILEQARGQSVTTRYEEVEEAESLSE